MPTSPNESKEIFALSAPDPALFTLYFIRALLTGPGLIVVLPYLYFRYHTLRYTFDEEGVHMRVGILFRREVNLTYARIQDIVTRDVPVLPLWYQANIVIAKKNVGNIKVDASGDWGFVKNLTVQ